MLKNGLEVILISVALSPLKLSKIRVQFRNFLYVKKLGFIIAFIRATLNVTAICTPPVL